MSARLIQVIEVNRERGKGTDADPYRRVLEYWSVDGNLLADHDAYMKQEKAREASRTSTT